MSEGGPVGKRRPLSRHLSADTTECTQTATSNFQLVHTLDLSDETTLVPETDRSEVPVRFCFGSPLTVGMDTRVGLWHKKHTGQRGSARIKSRWKAVYNPIL